ncbi:S1 family peptidase [Arthrobacter castelli]|uniref:S1 family peptidase n=1 Tax=Arthrobacter castelli TaxID=271431 RepID=UPI0004169A17|nr:S1 family peptidase [Arthrobacter castelli]
MARLRPRRSYGVLLLAIALSVTLAAIAFSTTLAASGASMAQSNPAGFDSGGQDRSPSRDAAPAAWQLADVQSQLTRFAVNHGAGQVQNWYVDQDRNSVVLMVRAGADDAKTRAFVEKAQSFGHRVDVERVRSQARSAAYLYGGQPVTLSNGKQCSIGFNARTSSGESIFLTAGHCAAGGPIAIRNGSRIGHTIGRSFPGNDYAAMTINRPNAWNPQPAVDKYNGYARVVRGHREPPVGSRVCKGGESTGWTCGTIQSYNQAVNYNGNIVYGLVRFSACVQSGDSGGAVMRGNYAVGIVSGAQMKQHGAATGCGQRTAPNVSFYQPIGEVLNAYDATLVTRHSGP